MVKAIVLASGQSLRVRPLGDKSLQYFLGKSLLRRHLDLLAQVGIGQVVIVTNPENDERIRDECKGTTSEVIFVLKEKYFGMGYAVSLGLEAVNPSDSIFITQAHDVLDFEFYSKLLRTASIDPEAILVAARRVESYFPGGYLIPLANPGSDETSPFAIQGIVEKPDKGAEPSNWINVVAHYIPNAGELADALRNETGAQNDGYERALTSLMQQRQTIAIPHEAPTASLKYPWHVLDIMELLLEKISGLHIHRSVHVAEGASVHGAVILSEGVRLYPGASVVGPAYVGAGTILGQGSLIRGSMTGRNCVIGHGTEVARSWLSDDVWLHSNYIGDSVIDSNVSFGSGTIVANLRLDESIISMRVNGERIDTSRRKLGVVVGTGARIGINVSLMPGIVVGRNAVVGPGVVLNSNVPDAKCVWVQQQLTLSENTKRVVLEGRNDFRSKLD